MRTVHWRGLMLATAAGAAVVPALVTAAPSAADPSTTTSAGSPSTITVVGNGSVEVTPDQASLEVDISRSASTSRAALSAANARTDAVVAAIRRTGVPASGIQTSQVSTADTSHRVGPAHHRHLVRRYTAAESLTVTMPARLAGRVVDVATRAGASDVDNLDFAFSNPDAGVSQANTAAIASARQQANAAAAAVGYVVTGVQSIDLDPDESTNSGTSGTASASAPTAAKTSTPTNVHPGQQQVTASVQVVYLIAPAS